MRTRFANVVWIVAFAAALIPACVAVGAQKPSELVDLNRATVAELLKVPGMTAAWAERIVRFRPYRTKLDLVNEGVVTPEVYQRIRDAVVAHRAAAEKAAGQGHP
jgi:DNA uptake protein ComE-like DNA-binding protein